MKTLKDMCTFFNFLLKGYLIGILDKQETKKWLKELKEKHQ